MAHVKSRLSVTVPDKARGKRIACPFCPTPQCRDAGTWILHWFKAHANTSSVRLASWAISCPACTASLWQPGDETTARSVHLESVDIGEHFGSITTACGISGMSALGVQEDLSARLRNFISGGWQDSGWGDRVDEFPAVVLAEIEHACGLSLRMSRQPNRKFNEYFYRNCYDFRAVGFGTSMSQWGRLFGATRLGHDVADIPSRRHWNGTAWQNEVIY